MEDGEGSGLGLSLFTKSDFLLLGRVWAGEQNLVQRQRNTGAFSYRRGGDYEGHTREVGGLWRGGERGTLLSDFGPRAGVKHSP